MFQKDKYGAYGAPEWKLHTEYSAVYIDIDRQLKVNYNHFG